MSGARRRPPVLGVVAALVFLAFMLVFFLWPLAHATKEAFHAGGKPSLDAFRALLENPGQARAFLRSVEMGVLGTLLASLLAVPAAFLLARCRFPGRGLFQVLVLAPLVLPPFVGAIGLKRIFSRFGALNLGLMDLFGLDRPPVDWLAGDLIGVVILQALHLYPILYLNLYASFAGIDASLEEAGRNLGLGSWGLFRRVLLPLVLPGYLAGAIIVFVWAFSDLGTPLLMGVRDVVAVQVFDRVNDIGDNPQGYALVLVVIVVSVAAFLLARALAPRAAASSATKGASRPVERTLHGRHAVLATGFLSALVALAVLPHVAVVLLSVAERWFLTPLPTAYSVRAYTLLAEHPLAASSIEVSVSLAAAATLIDLVLGMAVALGTTRGVVPFARLLDALAMAPLAVPGIVLAFGLVGAFAGTAIDPAARSPFTLLIASYAVRRLPFAVRSLTTGLGGLGVTLEEAARNLGLTPRQSFVRVTLPLVSPHLMAGALLVFVFAAVEVSDSLVLAVRPEHYPMTKAIWELLGRLDDGPFVASAMGVLTMALLAIGFLLAARALGKGASSVFRMGSHG